MQLIDNESGKVVADGVEAVQEAIRGTFGKPVIHPAVFHWIMSAGNEISKIIRHLPWARNSVNDEDVGKDGRGGNCLYKTIGVILAARMVGMKGILMGGSANFRYSTDRSEPAPDGKESLGIYTGYFWDDSIDVDAAFEAVLRRGDPSPEAHYWAMIIPNDENGDSNIDRVAVIDLTVSEQVVCLKNSRGIDWQDSCRLGTGKGDGLYVEMPIQAAGRRFQIGDGSGDGPHAIYGVHRGACEFGSRLAVSIVPLMDTIFTETAEYMDSLIAARTGESQADSAGNA